MTRKKFRVRFARMVRRRAGAPWGLAHRLARVVSKAAGCVPVAPLCLLYLRFEVDAVRALVEAAGGRLYVSYEACCSDPSHGTTARAVRLTFGARSLSSEASA